MRKKMVPLSTDSSGGERDRLVAIEAVSVTPKSLQHETDDAYRVVNQIAFRKNFRTLMNHFVDSE